MLEGEKRTAGIAVAAEVIAAEEGGEAGESVVCDEELK